MVLNSSEKREVDKMAVQFKDAADKILAGVFRSRAQFIFPSGVGMEKGMARIQKIIFLRKSKRFPGGGSVFQS